VDSLIARRIAAATSSSSQREDAPLGNFLERVTGAADALEEGRDGAGGADLDREVDVADIDAELEGRGRDEGPQFPRLQALFRVEASRPRETAVVARDGVLAEDARQARGDAFGHLARVDEDEGRAVVADEVGHPVVDLLPLLVGADGLERGGGDFDGEVEVAPVADVDEGAVAVASDEEQGISSERLLGRGGRCAGFCGR
jgi:hypothetical protein